MTCILGGTMPCFAENRPVCFCYCPFQLKRSLGLEDKWDAILPFTVLFIELSEKEIGEIVDENVLLYTSLGLPYKFEVQQMLEEPQWELVFEKTRWIIEKYRFSHRYVLWFCDGPRFAVFLIKLNQKAKPKLNIESWCLVLMTFYYATSCVSVSLVSKFLPTAVSPWIESFAGILT